MSDKRKTLREMLDIIHGIPGVGIAEIQEYGDEADIYLGPRTGIYYTAGLQRFMLEMGEKLGISQKEDFKYDDKGVTLGKLIGEESGTGRKISIMIFPNFKYAKEHYEKNWDGFIAKERLPIVWQEGEIPSVEMKFSVICQVRVSDKSSARDLWKEFQSNLEQGNKKMGEDWNLSEWIVSFLEYPAGGGNPKDKGSGFEVSGLKTSELSQIRAVISSLCLKNKLRLTNSGY